jgi:CBS domain-containing protein
MRCSELMKLRIECLSAHDSVQVAARRMRESNLGFLPVCDDELKVLGTITDRDLATRVVADGLPPSTHVHDIMTTEIVACRPDDDIRVAEQIMGDNHRALLLVLDGMQRFSGVITLSDVARYEDGSRLATTFRQTTEREARR